MMSLPVGYELTEVDPSELSEADLQSLHRQALRIHEENIPEVPGPTFVEFVTNLRGPWPGHKAYHWAIWRDDEAVGTAYLDISVTGQNSDKAFFWIGIHPEHRLQGLARELLRVVASRSRTEGRELLGTSSSARVPSGSAFATRIGASLSMEYIMSEVTIGALNRGVMTQWLARGEVLRQDFDLIATQGPWADSELDAICKMYEIMNTAPTGELQYEPEAVTPAHVRHTEARLADERRERWTTYARHRVGGEIAGYTEVFWLSTTPDLLEQEDTAVAPEHRGRGLASWLKAAMMERVLEERPEVQRVRTGNAKQNAPMLHINRQMGFTPYRTSFQWKVSLESIGRYLESRR
jgi:mycothiol synthase